MGVSRKRKSNKFLNNNILWIVVLIVIILGILGLSIWMIFENDGDKDNYEHKKEEDPCDPINTPYYKKNTVAVI